MLDENAYDQGGRMVPGRYKEVRELLRSAPEFFVVPDGRKILDESRIIHSIIRTRIVPKRR